MPEAVVQPGVFPVAQLDQRIIWVGTDGCAYRIDQFEIEDCVAFMDWSLANAKMLREQWSSAKRETYDETERPRRWILNRPAIRAMMAQIIRKEQDATTET